MLNGLNPNSEANVMSGKCIIAAMLLGAVFLLGGCNMVKGLGKDIHDSTQNVQEWIEGDSQNSRHIPPA